MRSQWFAQVTDNVVTASLLVSRDESDPVWQNIPSNLIATEYEVAVNSTYVDGIFTPPPPVVPPRVLSKFAFLRLLTPTEYAAMFTQTDPMLVYGVACFNAADDPFDIDNPLVMQMLDYCVATGALTQARKDELWATMEAAST
jgi:hypothetical protein